MSAAPEKRKRLSGEQKRVIINFMRRHGDIASNGRGHLWPTLVQKLHAVEGPKKTLNAWYDYWKLKKRRVAAKKTIIDAILANMPRLSGSELEIVIIQATTERTLNQRRGREIHGDIEQLGAGHLWPHLVNKLHAVEGPKRTLNAWVERTLRERHGQEMGIPIVSKNRKERIEAIAAYLQESCHTVVCLQEVWSEDDYLFIKEKLKHNLPYSHYFYSGVLGSGLCVFSKWLIQDVFFHQWPLNGYIHKIHHGDWFGGKGVGLCRIKVKDRLVNIYCTHLHAEYHEDDMYSAHRALQAHSTAEFVNLTKSNADVSVLAGDLNTGPGDLSYRLITELPSLIDPYDLECESSNPAIRKATGTSDNCNNSYSDKKQVKLCPEGKRIDHILYYVNSQWAAEAVNFGNPLEDRVPGQPFSYSDHNAVTLELRMRPAEGSYRDQVNKDGSLDDTIADAYKVCNEACTILSRTRKLYLLAGGLIFMFLLGSVGYWPNKVFYNILKILVTGLCFYNLVMGTLWNRIEMNSLKAGLSALDNFVKSRSHFQNGYREPHEL